MNPLWLNIPAELRLIDAWVCAGDDKVPKNALTGFNASPSDEKTWCSFEQACAAGYKFIGFCYHPRFGFTCADLDDPTTIKANGVQVPNPDAEEVAERIARHERVSALFNSYSEISQSGKGVHIVIRGTIPANLQREKVELYSVNHYVIMTGNVLNPAPIGDFQKELEIVAADMVSTRRSELVETAPTFSDLSILQTANKASNNAKFDALWKGQINGYPSASEADFALLSMLAFYSQSNEQVRRLFRMSKLGERDKATKNDDYLDRSLSKIRGRQETAMPYVDLSGLLAKHSLNGAHCPPPPAPILPSIFPVGLIGEIADYIYSSAIRPVPEVALTAAIALGAGVLGRHFNISNTGLNQYVIFLGNTGVGKECASSGIESIISAIRGQVPGADEFIGPGAFASGQALTRAIDKHNSFVSIMGEIGITLGQICDKNAGSHQVQFRKVLLDLYTKSGWNNTLRPSVYSDTEKNTTAVKAPCVTIFGESTPDRFYGALGLEHISEGLISRFTVIQYDGDRPNPNDNAFHPPSPMLVSRLVQMFQTVLNMKHNDTCATVQMDVEGKRCLDEYGRYSDTQINGGDEVNRQLWNRAHLKALKLAGLIAVGCDMHNPVVTKAIAEWAIALINRDVHNMVSKFADGEVGQGDHKCEADIRKAVAKYGKMNEKERAAYNVPKLLLDKKELIPFSYLKQYCKQRVAFKNDRRGAIVALNSNLTDLCKAGVLVQIPTEQARKELGVDSAVYARGEAWA